jgi:hypothetical protein
MSRSLGFPASLSFAIALLWSSAAGAQGVADAERHYDARIDYNVAFIASQRALPAQSSKPFVANLEEASGKPDAVRRSDDPLADRSRGCEHGEPGRSRDRRRADHAAVR